MSSSRSQSATASTSSRPYPRNVPSTASTSLPRASRINSLTPAPRKLGAGNPAASSLGGRAVFHGSLRKLRSRREVSAPRLEPASRPHRPASLVLVLLSPEHAHQALAKWDGFPVDQEPR